ncbi:homoserine O-acetyltransferase MetX [Haliovirga abyssi]|uniref:Homoserine O-acetyltransferase n=1 Tax=Haliovirga abyssi TaxID=2996794 RepID=A0AAU9DZS4_9FUSO|nr:homoserine O-acetyltransferase [Haliovirga abyssi]BDU49515.1 homoserine O-acetyltransferase [Haliovirga abyssi]
MKNLTGKQLREEKFPPNLPETINLKHGKFTFATGNSEFPLLKLESGMKFGPITLDYETYGTLNKNKDNAILICHALTGNSHVAGRLDKDSETGWWDPIIGPGRPLDTNKYFIVCSNILGGCSGSTGPNSINPETKEPYAMKFPTITIKDMVETQKILLEKHFGIYHLKSVIGGSIGGMQALQWGVTYPDFMDKLVVIAATSKLSPQSIAFNKIGRHAIMIDPKWNGGNYYKEKRLLDGLALARMVAHITYLSDEAMQIKFGRKHANITEYFDFDEKFEVENYLDHQGYKFVKKFDANSYLYLSKAMDLFDISRDFNSLEDALDNIKAKEILIMSFTSDWLFPSYQSQEMSNILKEKEKNVEYHEINTYSGHDSFLIEYDKINPIIDNFINKD